MSNEGHVTGEQLGTLPLIEAVYVDTVSGNFYLGLRAFVCSLGLQVTYWEPILKCAITACFLILFFPPMPPHVLSDFVVSTPAVAEV